MEQYSITGMSCAACSTRVEKAVSRVPGVTSCAVNLLTNSMGVEGSVPAEEIVKAVKEAGYGAAPKKAAGAERLSAGQDGRNVFDGRTKGKQEAGADFQKEELHALKKRLCWSVPVLFVLMYFSMGHMMWNFPLPAFMSRNPAAPGEVQLLLTVLVMIINQKFFISGFRALLHRAPNMDTLVALGAGAAFGYSTWELLLGSNDFYFESAAMILTLITVGKTLEARSKGKTTDALKHLIQLAPKRAVLLRNGVEVEVPIEEVKKGDIFMVRPGENIPVDGVVLLGNSAVNEAAITGESVPVDKFAGDRVTAACVNQSGFLKCEALRVGEDTTLSQIIKMVSDAAATKAPIAKAADRVSGIFVPVVIGIAAVTIFGWLLFGESIGFALARGISVLVISCPCALGLATPVAIMVGNGKGAQNGILFKTAVSLEETGKARIAVLDKTGTITEGEPKVTEVYAAAGHSEAELLELACALEKKSEHPFARAISAYGEEQNLQAAEVTDFQVLPGKGLTAVCEGAVLAGGNKAYIDSLCEIPKEEKERAVKLSEEGKTPLFFAKDNSFVGMIAAADVIRKDSQKAVKEMQNMGLHVVMLTGDNERTAQAIGRQAGVDEVIAGVLPDGKESAVRAFMEKGRVLMVGDGINDAPALKRANVGVAIGAGTDIAIDAADVVLMKSRLSDVPAAIRLSRAVLRNIHENLFWAFFYNVVGIPLAAGVFIPLFRWQLSPMFGAAAMSLSSFCVVTNALRLNFVKVYNERRDKRRESNLNGSHCEKDKKQEEIKMEKTMKIEGMMCGHCEARVKKCLEALPQVESAAVSHEAGTAVVTLQAEVSDEVLKEAVEAQDYKVVSVE